MPTYEYACRDCGNHVEVVQAVTDAPLTTCTVCGGPLRKVFHPAGIVFKGSGFYATDSRGTTAPKDGEGKAAATTSEGARGGKGATGREGTPGGEGTATARAAGAAKETSP